MKKTPPPKKPPFFEVRIAPHRSDPTELPLVIMAFHDSASYQEVYLACEEVEPLVACLQAALAEAKALVEGAK